MLWKYEEGNDYYVVCDDGCVVLFGGSWCGEGGCGEFWVVLCFLFGL